MLNDRLSVLLPVKTTVVKGKETADVTHIQIKKNDKVKKYELRLFEYDNLVVKKEYHNMTINVLSNNANAISLEVSEDNKQKLEIKFEESIDIVQVKKYVDTLLI